MFPDPYYQRVLWCPPSGQNNIILGDPEPHYTAAAIEIELPMIPYEEVLQHPGFIKGSNDRKIRELNSELDEQANKLKTLLGKMIKTRQLIAELQGGIGDTNPKFPINALSSIETTLGALLGAGHPKVIEVLRSFGALNASPEKR